MVTYLRRIVLLVEESLSERVEYLSEARAKMAMSLEKLREEVNKS
jgi:hypothetical protein